ncbi:MAG: MFS transporter [Pseudomonadales bacterium]|nr:MFS transporter [Pseudomonadales bacterium]
MSQQSESKPETQPDTQARPQAQKPENPWINILFNILIPVFILNQLTRRLDENGPLIALLVALAFPLGYGIYDYLTRKKKNWLSLLGIVNVGFTGGMGLFQLEGIWFAIKEATFPALIGIAVYVSAFTRNPLMKLMAVDTGALDMQRISLRLTELGKEGAFFAHLRKSTKLMAVSFAISSFLNFVIAIRVFTQIDTALPELERQAILNEQIADMTWLGFAFIALPLMVFTFAVMWYLIAGIKRLTGLSLEEIMMIEADDEDDDGEAATQGEAEDGQPAGIAADAGEKEAERHDR